MTYNQWTQDILYSLHSKLLIIVDFWSARLTIHIIQKMDANMQNIKLYLKYLWWCVSHNQNNDVCIILWIWSMIKWCDEKSTVINNFKRVKYLRIEELLAVASLKGWGITSKVLLAHKLHDQSTAAGLATSFFR
jgi:hypothetical protein